MWGQSRTCSILPCNHGLFWPEPRTTCLHMHTAHVWDAHAGHPLFTTYKQQLTGCPTHICHIATRHACMHDRSFAFAFLPRRWNTNNFRLKRQAIACVLLSSYSAVCKHKRLNQKVQTEQRTILSNCWLFLLGARKQRTFCSSMSIIHLREQRAESRWDLVSLTAANRTDRTVGE